MINNIKHLLRTIKHLFMILLLFLLLYDTKVSLCYIHEAIVSLFDPEKHGATSSRASYLIGTNRAQIECDFNIGVSFLIALASNNKGRGNFSFISY